MATKAGFLADPLEAPEDCEVLGDREADVQTARRCDPRDENWDQRLGFLMHDVSRACVAPRSTST